MNGYSLGPPGGENFGQALYIPHEYGPGVETVQWDPSGPPGYIASEWFPGAKSVMFENGVPPGFSPTLVPSPMEIAAMQGYRPPQAQSADDLEQTHLLLL